MNEPSVVLPFRRPAATTCAKHGDFEPLTVGEPPFAIPLGCPSCAEERKARRGAEERRAILDDRIGRSNIPDYYLRYTLDNYPARSAAQQRVLKVCRDYARDYAAISQRAPGTNCVVLSGSFGTGKTSLACAMLQRIAEQDRGVYFVTASAIRQRVAGCWQAGTSREKVITYFANVELLAIDEIGASAHQPDVMAKEQIDLFDILNERYQHNRPTILVTNLPPKRTGDYAGPIIADALGERLNDRLKVAVHLPFHWPSMRGAQ
jgi:DNA replication protein DnaC